MSRRRPPSDPVVDALELAFEALRIENARRERAQREHARAAADVEQLKATRAARRAAREAEARAAREAAAASTGWRACSDVEASLLDVGRVVLVSSDDAGADVVEVHDWTSAVEAAAAFRRALDLENVRDLYACHWLRPA